MSGKSAELYKQVFQYIENNVFKMKPSQFMTDFEAGMRKAIEECYPNAILHGCWYHFCAAIRRKLVTLQLYQLIVEVPSAMAIYRMILNLPLLPSEFILEGFQVIKKIARDRKLYKQFKSLFEYFENFWLQLVR